MDPIAANEKRAAFFKLLFGNNKGLVCLAYITPSPRKKFEEEFFEYPDQLSIMLDAVQLRLHSGNIYFCPQLLRERKRDKGSVETTPNIWADLDSCDPDKMLVPPSIVLETSPERFQAFWLLEKAIDPDDAEELARRIAYKHAEDGADRSGWDLTQLLRVPFTYNFKYGDNPPQVAIIHAERSLYRPTDFESYPKTPEYIETSIPMPDESELTTSPEELLQEKRTSLNPLIWRYFVEEPVNDWSKVLWNLQMMLYEAGYTREQVYIIVREAKCNKYSRDGKAPYLLWKEVCRAENKFAINTKLLIPTISVPVQLLNSEERDILEQLPATFVERYIEWASQLGDAAQQYHQAGAFIALSSILSGSIVLPTSYGTVVPNIWFMILADTTLTRKTTSMDIAMELVMDVDPDILMATDGSLEGMLNGLASRPGRPSVFLRDEFSGLLEQITKKDYMAGMAEMLTKLYDGKHQKRILRKEVVEVKDPRLIVFAGGIKNKVTSLLTLEHVSSGFMPRFVFITAESDISKLRPIGPPTEISQGNRDAIMAELEDIYKHYNQYQTLTIERTKGTIERRIKFEAQLTPDAWIRYNQLETELLESGLKDKRPEVMTPVGDRLAKSILKAALLIAASRQRDERIIVEVTDLLRAIRFGERWRYYIQDVMDNVGKSNLERQFDTVLNAVRKKGSAGVSRSYLMQAYHLSARDAAAILETLEQRGAIIRQRSGRTELIVATNLK